MNILLLIVLSSIISGCADEETSHPLTLSVRSSTLPGGRFAPLVTHDGKLVGYDDARRAVVELSAHGASTIIPVTDSVLDAMPTRLGYLLAVRMPAGVRIDLIVGRKSEHVTVIPAVSGRFVPITNDSVIVWQSDGRFYVLSSAGTQQVSTVVVRREARLLADSSILVILDWIAPQLYLWEGIDLYSGRKAFSSFLGGRFEHATATAKMAAALVRVRGAYQVEWYRRNERGDAILYRTTTLPPDYYEPHVLIAAGDTLIALFSSGVVLLTTDGLVAEDRNWRDDFSDTVRLAYRQGNTFVLARMSSIVRIDMHRNPWWWFETSIPIAARLMVVATVLAVFVMIARRFGRYRRLVGALLDRGSNGALMLIDRQLRLQRLNKAARVLFGIGHDVPLGRPIGVYFASDDWDCLLHCIEQSVHQRLPCIEEVDRSKNSSEQERRYIISTEPLFSAFNRFEGVLVSVVDVTEQYQQWRLLNWAQVAHDMQTALTTIRLSAEQLEQHVDPTTVETLRQRIARQTQVLLERVRDLLVLGRGEKMRWEEYPLSALFEEVVADIRPLVPAQISIVIRPTPLVVKIDRRRLARALHNALINAIGATSEKTSGFIEMWAEYHSDFIVIGIEDNGRGMDAETLQRFQRALFTTNRTGHGYGSMIMQQMVKLHGGRMEVRSAPGVGTTILFHLPASLYVRHHD